MGFSLDGVRARGEADNCLVRPCAVGGGSVAIRVICITLCSGGGTCLPYAVPRCGAAQSWALGGCEPARSKLWCVFIFRSGSSADLPVEARPDAELATFIPRPTEWITVLGASLPAGYNWGIGSYLTPPSSQERALAEATGEHGAGGHAGICTTYPDGTIEFDEGQTGFFEAEAEFFVHRRDHHGLAEPSVEFRHSFLWYFDAIPRNDGSWYYLDDAGSDHELVRVTHSDQELRVDVAALPLRRYLAARERVLVLQLDRVTRLDDVPEPKIDAVDRTELRHFAFHSGDIRSSEKPGFVRLVGKQIVLPVDAAPEDLERPHPSEKRHPQFTIGVDPDTGKSITASCDPDQLSDYHTDRGGPHYLTRVYFKPAVLARYTARPSRYQVTESRLSCLSLWGISIGTNPEGLIEAYLGDLGRHLPADERDYWASFNTPPAGGRDETRYRRDILGAWVDGPPHPLRELFAARARFSDSMTALLGAPVYNPWNVHDQIAFDGLHLPTANEQSEADNLTLRLAKGIVDYLDVKAVRHLPGVKDANGQSINCLQDWVADCGADTEKLISPLRLLQGLRSTGAAHARGSGWDKTLTRAGLNGLGPNELFIQVLALATDALNGLADLAEQRKSVQNP